MRDEAAEVKQSLMGLGGSHLYSQAKPGAASGMIHPNPSSAQRCRQQGLTCWPPAKMALQGAGGQQVACLSSHTTRRREKEVDSMYRCFFSSLQLHQFNCSSKVTASALPHPSPMTPPDLGLLLPERKQPWRCHYLLRAEARGLGLVCVAEPEGSEALPECRGPDLGKKWWGAG